jgi:protein phosphatase 2C family protein 2/3
MIDNLAIHKRDTSMKKIFIISLLFAQSVMAHPSAEYKPQFELVWGLSARQGDRPTMEDTHVNEVAFQGVPERAFFAIYDGHGGKEAAEIAAEKLHTYLGVKSRKIGRALKKAFLSTDCLIMNTTNSGSCAAVSYLNKDDLHIAWVGDSRVVLGRNKSVLYATEDHKPDKPSEEERIKKAGGYVTTRGVSRVNGQLAVARALGDRTIKETPGLVIATPEIHHEKIQKNDILIIACDGIWDVISNQQAITIVENALQQSNPTLEEECPAQPLLRNKMFEDPYVEEAGNTHLLLVARALRDAAYQKGSTDNLSVLVVVVK